MKLLDYIRGLRKGKEAHRLERESMQDPFLADAMDGYSQVEGNHEQRIEKLRMQVSAHSAKKNNSPVLPAEDLILYYEERDLSAFVVRLNCNPLPFQILKCPDFTLGSYNHHLTTVHIRSCPLIFVFSFIHGIAAPQTVYCSI